MYVLKAPNMSYGELQTWTDINVAHPLGVWPTDGDLVEEVRQRAVYVYSERAVSDPLLIVAPDDSCLVFDDDFELLFLGDFLNGCRGVALVSRYTIGRVARAREFTTIRKVPDSKPWGATLDEKDVSYD